MARPTTSAGSAAHFIPHVQGLRAIAVLLVVSYHFWPGRITGGYIGVDVFFVISGFLITSQLSRELVASSRIGLLSFWAKRVRRLIPASLFVLAISAVLVAAVMPVAYMHESVWDIAASALYWQNWHLAAGSVNYLASAGHTIAEHYWSLSLEEQFYIVWPLFLLGAFAVGVRATSRRRWAIVVVCVVVISTLSLGASVWFTAFNPAEAYFVLFTRMWEFGAGALLALYPKCRARRRLTSNALGLIGLVLVFGSALVLTSESPFPGWLALFPVLGTVSLIAMSAEDRRFGVSRVLSIRPLTFIGDISYSLYLWHWPLIVIAPFVIGWGLGTVNRVVLFVASFVLAWLTKRFVEDPVRRLPYLVSRPPRFTFGWMLVALAVIGGLLAGTYALTQPKYEAAAAELSEVATNPPACFGAAVITGCSNAALNGVIIPSPDFGSADRPGNDNCFVQLNETKLVSCTFGSTASNAPRVALIGDSHAYQFIDSLAREAEANGWSLTTYLKGACPWTTADPLDSNPAFVASCREWRSALTRELETVERYDVIVTTAFASALVDASGSVDAAAATLAETWTTQANGAHLVVIADNPVVEFDPNNCLRSSTPKDCEFARSNALVIPDPLVVAADLVPMATVVDFTSVYCNATVCRVVVSGADVYRDQDHLTATFANTMGPWLGQHINASIRMR